MKNKTKTEYNFYEYNTKTKYGNFEALLFVPKKKVEVFVVYVHGYNSFGAWESLFFNKNFLNENYAVLMPSQAGFSYSGGVRDFCGPKTVEGIYKIINEVLEEKKFKKFKEKIVLYGISRGALVSGLLCAKYPDFFKKVILQSGNYNLKKRYEERLKNPKFIKIINLIKKETGGTDKALEERTLVNFAENIKADVLILHGKEDKKCLTKYAEEFYKKLNVKNKKIKLIKNTNIFTRLPFEKKVKKHIFNFINQ